MSQISDTPELFPKERSGSVVNAQFQVPQFCPKVREAIVQKTVQQPVLPSFYPTTSI